MHGADNHRDQHQADAEADDAEFHQQLQVVVVRVVITFCAHYLVSVAILYCGAGSALKGRQLIAPGAARGQVET